VVLSIYLAELMLPRFIDSVEQQMPTLPSTMNVAVLARRFPPGNQENLSRFVIHVSLDLKCQVAVLPVAKEEAPEAPILEHPEFDNLVRALGSTLHLQFETTASPGQTAMEDHQVRPSGSLVADPGDRPAMDVENQRSSKLKIPLDDALESSLIPDDHQQL